MLHEIKTVEQLSKHFTPAKEFSIFLAEGKYYSITTKKRGGKAYATLLQGTTQIGSPAIVVRKVEIPDWLYWVAMRFNQDYILFSVLGANAEKPAPKHLTEAALIDVDIIEKWK